MFFPGKSGESSVARIIRNSTFLWPIIILRKQPGECVSAIGTRCAILPIPEALAKMAQKPLKKTRIRKDKVLSPMTAMRPAGAGTRPNEAARS